MHCLKSLIAPIDPDDVQTFEDETLEDDEGDGVAKPTGAMFIPEAEKVKRVCNSMFQMPKKEVGLKTEEERMAEESEMRNRREEWRLQTFLNNSMDDSEGKTLQTRYGWTQEGTNVYTRHVLH
jgi:hypothetical protein